MARSMIGLPNGREPPYMAILAIIGHTGCFSSSLMIVEACRRKNEKSSVEA